METLKLHFKSKRITIAAITFKKKLFLLYENDGTASFLKSMAKNVSFQKTFTIFSVKSQYSCVKYLSH